MLSRSLPFSSTQLTEVGATNYTCRHPVGVAGQITPWNLPLYLLTFKIAPALASGCTVVCKSSEMTSLTAYMLAKVMVEAGEWQWLRYPFSLLVWTLVMCFGVVTYYRNSENFRC